MLQFDEISPILYNISYNYSSKIDAAIIPIRRNNRDESDTSSSSKLEYLYILLRPSNFYFLITKFKFSFQFSLLIIKFHSPNYLLSPPSIECPNPDVFSDFSSVFPPSGVFLYIYANYDFVCMTFGAKIHNFLCFPFVRLLFPPNYVPFCVYVA